MSVPPQQRPGTLPGVLRAAAERYGDKAAYVEGDRTSPSPSCSSRCAPSPAATWRSASNPATASWCGRRTASTGWSPASRSRTPAEPWCRRTAATPGTRWPTSSTAPARVSCWSRTGSSTAPRSPTCRRASDLASVLEVVDLASLDWVSQLGDESLAEEVEARADAVSPDDVADILFTSGTTGRPKGAMSAHRQTDRGGGRLGQPGRGLCRGPLSRGEPVLPLLRLQDRHRRRAADRRHALPRRQLRPGRRRCS